MGHHSGVLHGRPRVLLSVGVALYPRNCFLLLFLYFRLVLSVVRGYHHVRCALASIRWLSAEHRPHVCTAEVNDASTINPHLPAEQVLRVGTGYLRLIIPNRRSCFFCAE